MKSKNRRQTEHISAVSMSKYQIWPGRMSEPGKADTQSSHLCNSVKHITELHQLNASKGSKETSISKEGNRVYATCRNI